MPSDRNKRKSFCGIGISLKPQWTWYHESTWYLLFRNHLETQVLYNFSRAKTTSRIFALKRIKVLKNISTKAFKTFWIHLFEEVYPSPSHRKEWWMRLQQKLPRKKGWKEKLNKEWWYRQFQLILHIHCWTRVGCYIMLRFNLTQLCFCFYLDLNVGSIKNMVKLTLNKTKKVFMVTWWW